jgi:hypothetical protein
MSYPNRAINSDDTTMKAAHETTAMTQGQSRTEHGPGDIEGIAIPAQWSATSTCPLGTKYRSAAALVEKLTTLAALEACRKSSRNQRTNAKIMKLPAPGPKKPS